jgi:hypothetical protein
MKPICQNIVKKDSLYPLIKHHVPLWDSDMEYLFQEVIIDQHLLNLSKLDCIATKSR